LVHYIFKRVGVGLLTCFSLCVAWNAKAQNAPSAVPITITADSLLYSELNGAKIQQMIGHVQFSQGSLSGTADNAKRYIDQNRVELTGHVVIRQDTLSLMAPTVTYEGNTRVGHAEGGVSLMDRDVTLTAGKGDYDANSQIAVFHDHVKVVQGFTQMFSNDLTYYRATETSWARGNVSLTNETGTMHADELTHSKALEETTANGHVDLRTDSILTQADWLYDSKLQGISFMRGHVMVHNRKDNTTIFGDTLARNSKLGHLVVPKHPLLLLIDSSESKDSFGRSSKSFDTLFVRSKFMEAYQGDSARFIAIDSVSLYRQGMSAIGGKLYYDDNAGYMTLSNAPRQYLWYDSTEIVGDSIAILFTKKKIRQMNAIGRSFTTSPLEELPNSGRIQQLQGERTELRIDHDTIRSVLAVSNALSIYFLVQDGKPDGMNRSSGDSIRIDFKNKTVNRVVIISGTEGEFWPERFVSGRASAFRLASYERNMSLRPRREQFVVPGSILKPDGTATEVPKPTVPKSKPKKTKR
jgi:lipopolysaccharide export system protein LptA